uniref:Uncharacterized protein n=1 Tax=Hyaloperonospora arabidopsidis (strain Emoy2) TaxID=559515 RepID=M4BWJ9_HYAAE
MAPPMKHHQQPDARQRNSVRIFGRKRDVPRIGKWFPVLGSVRARGFPCSEKIQVDIPGQNLKGIAKRYYNQQVEGWWEEEPTLAHAMQRLLHNFATKITSAQSMKMSTAAKSSRRICTEHYLYLVVISEARGGADNLVLDNIVYYADPAMRVSMLSGLNLAMTDSKTGRRSRALCAIDGD